MGKPGLKLVVLLSAVLLTGVCQAGDSTVPERRTGVPELAGSGFSQQGFEGIQQMMETAITDGRITAGIAMLARDGRIAWLGTAGEMTPGIPMRDDAILPLASVGKMFTAVATRMKNSPKYFSTRSAARSAPPRPFSSTASFLCAFRANT